MTIIYVRRATELVEECDLRLLIFLSCVNINKASIISHLSHKKVDRHVDDRL